MTAYARGGQTTITPITPDEWPDDWPYPPDTDGLFDEPDINDPLPPWWPKKVKKPEDFTLAISSTKNAIIWKFTTGTADDTSETVFAIPFEVTITNATGFKNHRLVVQAGWDGTVRGNTRSTPQQFAMTGENQTITGTINTTVKSTDITQVTMNLRCRIITSRDKESANHNITMSSYQPDVMVAAGCTGETLAVTTGLAAPTSGFTINAVTSATCTEE